MTEQLNIVIPSVNSEPDDTTDTNAAEAAHRACKHNGLKPGPVRHVSSKPWTAPLGDVGPIEGLTLHHYTTEGA